MEGNVSHIIGASDGMNNRYTVLRDQNTMTNKADQADDYAHNKPKTIKKKHVIDKPTPTQRTTKGLKIGHLNIRSLPNKIDEVRIIMNEHHFDILAISETWLSDDIPSETVHISGYHLYRNDRRSHGGGVLLYIKDTIQHTYCPGLHQSSDTEIVWAKINNGSSYPFYIACVYNTSPDNEKYYKAMLNNFENVLKKNKEIVIVGDLNINYDLDEKKYNNQAHYIEMLLNCRQLILEPTRVTLNTSSIIDHIYTTMPNNHVQSGVLKYTVSDHYLVYTILSFKKDTTPGKILHKKSYDKMDTGAFLNELMLSQLYNIVSLSDNVQDAWVKWSDQFNSIVNRHVSTKQIRVKNTPNP